MLLSAVGNRVGFWLCSPGDGCRVQLHTILRDLIAVLNDMSHSEVDANAVCREPATSSDLRRSDSEEESLSAHVRVSLTLESPELILSWLR